MLILTTSGHFTVISGRWENCLISIKVADACPKFFDQFDKVGEIMVWSSICPTPLHTVYFWTGVFHFRSTVHFKDRPLPPLLTVDLGSDRYFGKYTSEISLNTTNYVNTCKPGDYFAFKWFFNLGTCPIIGHLSTVKN